jgi:predicted transcriptional regulator
MTSDSKVLSIRLPGSAFRRLARMASQQERKPSAMAALLVKRGLPEEAVAVKQARREVYP